MRMLIVCGAVVLLSGQALAAETGPVYTESGSKGVNPLHETRSDRGQAPTPPPEHTGQSGASVVGGGGQSVQVQSNPIYQGPTADGSNPIHKDD